MRQAQANYSLEGYAYYIASEKRPKKPDLFVLKGLYERAIAEADKRRFIGEANAEEALRSFWTGYVDLLVRLTSSRLSPDPERFPYPENASCRRGRTTSSAPTGTEECACLRGASCAIYSIPGSF